MEVNDAAQKTVPTRQTSTIFRPGSKITDRLTCLQVLQCLMCHLAQTAADGSQLKLY